MHRTNQVSDRLEHAFRSIELAGEAVPNAVARFSAEVGPLSPANSDGAGFRQGVQAAFPVSTGDFYQRHGKRALDIVIVLATLPLTLPIIAIAAIALWIEGGFPLYRQQRLGRNGKSFAIYKLRTMVCDAEVRLAELLDRDPALKAEWDVTQKLKCDPRITPIGNFLRRTSIDELPQIWNVLVGDMSLVGPRPMMPDQLDLYGDPRAYFALLPGISGFWQVSDRNESHFTQRTDADWDYLRRVSLGVDLAVLAKTSLVVLRRTGY